jgi:predicted solute-binding protein
MQNSTNVDPLELLKKSAQTTIGFKKSLYSTQCYIAYTQPRWTPNPLTENSNTSKKLLKLMALKTQPYSKVPEKTLEREGSSRNYNTFQ